MKSRQRNTRSAATVPALRRPAGLAERALGVLSVIGGYVVPAVAIDRPVGRVVGILISVALWALVLGWQTFHLGAAGRRPWTRVERGLCFAAAIAMTLPMTQLVWPSAEDRHSSALIAPALPAVLLAVFLMLRWRKDD